MPRIPAGVQDLQCNLAAQVMHRTCDGGVLCHLLWPVEQRTIRLEQALRVRREAAGNDKCHTATRPLGVEARDTLRPAVERLQPRMHRAHHGAIDELREAEIEGAEKV